MIGHLSPFLISVLYSRTFGALFWITGGQLAGPEARLASSV